MSSQPPTYAADLHADERATLRVLGDAFQQIRALAAKASGVGWHDLPLTTEIHSLLRPDRQAAVDLRETLAAIYLLADAAHNLPVIIADRPTWNSFERGCAGLRGLSYAIVGESYVTKHLGTPSAQERQASRNMLDTLAAQAEEREADVSGGFLSKLRSLVHRGRIFKKGRKGMRPIAEFVGPPHPTDATGRARGSPCRRCTWDVSLMENDEPSRK